MNSLAKANKNFLWGHGNKVWTADNITITAGGARIVFHDV
jgi:hypothetical protein